MIKGIDTSVWQGNVNFKNVKKDGYSFVMIRAGYGNAIAYPNQKDPQFESSYKKAKEAGMGVGAYWYTYAVDKASAIAEANSFLTTISGKEFDYPIVLDIEDAVQTRLSNATIGTIVDAFCQTCEKAGYYISVYSFASFFNRIPTDILKKYDVWVAHFTSASKPSYNGAYGMWQYSDNGRVSGISGAVDLNNCYKDYPTIIKNAGLNGYKKAKTTKTETKPKTEEKKETSAPATQFFNYTIKSGDTLWAISRRYGVSIVQIAEDNGIKNVNVIYAGQTIKIRRK